jgi:CRP-like cAMP-binding protein
VSGTDTIASREFGPGDVLFKEGDAGDVMYVIREGTVRLWKDIDGEPTTLAELREGDFVGEVGLVRARPQTATATALSPTKCLVLDGQALEEMVTQNAELAVRFIRGLVDRLAQSHDLMAMIGQRDTRTRVAMAIVRHAEASTDRRPEGIWIAKRLGDIGDEVAVSRNEMGEISKYFLKLKLLSIKRDGILVPNVSRLYGFVKTGDV